VNGSESPRGAAPTWAGQVAGQIVEMNSVAAIRKTVRGLDVDSGDLTAELERLATLAAEQGHLAQERHIVFVRGLIEGVAEEVGWPRPAEDGPVHDVLARALQERSSLGMLGVLRSRRDLLTPDVLSEVQLWWASGRTSGLDSGRRIGLICIIGVLLGGAHAARAQLMWAARCRHDGQLRSSEHHLRRAEALAGDMEEIEDPALPQLIASAQAALYDAMGDDLRAAAANEKALEHAEAAGQSEFVTSAHRRALAGNYRDLGRYTEALAMIDACLRVDEQLEDMELELRDRNMRGLLLEDLGDYEGGLPEYERAEALARALGDRSAEFEMMNNAATSFLKRGDAREGVARFRRILARVQSWSDARAVASTYNNLGTALMAMDRPAEALDAYRRAFEEKVRGAPRGMALSAAGMVDALDALGEIDGARTWCDLLLVSYAESGDPQILLSYLTRVVREATEDDDDVWAMVEEGLEAAVARGDMQAELLLARKLADRHRRQGQPGRALDLYRETIARAAANSPSSPLLERMRLELARSLTVMEGSAGEAYEILRGIVDGVEKRVAGMALERRRSEAVGEWIDAYEALMELLLTREQDLSVVTGGRAQLEAFELHEAAKARSFLASLAHAPFQPPPSVPADLRERERHLREVTRSLQEAYGGEVGSEAYRLRRLREVAAERNELWTEMREAAPAYVRLRTGAVPDAGEIQELLRGARVPTALVSFFVGSQQSSCFVLRSDDPAIVTVRLPVTREALKTAAARLRATFNGSPSQFPPLPPILRDRPFDRDLDFLDQIGAELLRFLPAVEGAELLLVAPHGPLHLLPIHALRDTDGRYVIERFGVSYVPSLSTLLYAVRSKDDERPQPPSVYAAGVASASDRHPEFFEEDRAIFEGMAVRLVTGVGVTGASKTQIEDQIGQHDVAHLTCHGHFDDVDPMRSGLLVSDGAQRPPRNLAAIPLGRRAGFLLSAQELLEGEVPAELVTLRACSTGLQSERNAGDEFEGLTRSLLYSGARSVIASLWNVDQRSSLALLRRFYSYWIGSGVRDEKWRALARAQRDFLIEADETYLRHPYHWAPLTLIGDWR
jgi:tetratricopeptide (TPR) repeat protein